MPGAAVGFSCLAHTVSQVWLHFVGAAAGCDLGFFKSKVKRSQPAAAPTELSSIGYGRS
ncbi:hypothetical protein EMIT0P4_100155 [Pseudomonas sp. IT-P4]